MMSGATSRSYTLEEILQQLKNVHGELYDYSRFKYSGNHRKAIIGCRKHGWFEQCVANHKSGHGCPTCCNEKKGKSIKLNQEMVLESFRAAHGDLYDYSRVNYSGNTTKVTIGCPVHGWFEQVPKSHKKGIGCAKCGPSRCAKSRKVTLDEFIRKSKTHHGDRFDYSLVDLKHSNIKNKVKIICPIHGVTHQQAYHHMMGFGCKKCDANRVGNMSRIDHNEFIKRCISKHGNKYDYSKTLYKGAYKTVCITCKEHGDFYMKATFHSARGYGCQKCWRSSGEHAISFWLDSHGFTYINEKRFNDCRSPKGFMMKFDFYLEQQNLLIEFDGEQHYVATDMFGGKEALAIRKQYDEIKDQYAKRKGIRMIRIPFSKKKNVGDLLFPLLHHTAVEE